MSVCNRDDCSLFFFSSRRRHTRCSRDWSSDVCSSDLVRMDVTDTASIMRARGEVERALGATPLIALVNNAGIPAAGPLELFPLDDLRRGLGGQMVWVVVVTEGVLPPLQASAGRRDQNSPARGGGARPRPVPQP